MNNKDFDLHDLTKKHLGIIETQTFASNLNRIERERERQNNPGKESYLFGFIAGILLFPLGLYMAFQVLCSSKAPVEIIITLIGTAFAAWADYIYIEIYTNPLKPFFHSLDARQKSLISNRSRRPIRAINGFDLVFISRRLPSCNRILGIKQEIYEKPL